MRHGGGDGRETALPFAVLRPAQREVYAPRRVRALPRGDRRALRPRRAARRLRRRARGPGAVRAVGDDVGATRARRRTRCRTCRLRHIYRHADAIVTYGPHVSAYVRAPGAARPGVRGAAGGRRRVLGGAARREPDRRAPFQVLFVGRDRAREGRRRAARRVARVGPERRRRSARARRRRPEARAGGARRPAQPGRSAQLLRRAATLWSYRRSPRATFREPWGLVVNEAFDQGVPVIATDAVGAAAGGLVAPRAHRPRRARRRRPARCAAALRRLHDDPGLRARLGAAAREAVAAYTPRRLGGRHVARSRVAGAAEEGC